MKVIKFTPRAPEEKAVIISPNTDTIEVIQAVLEMAEKGELRDVVLVGTLNDKSMLSAWCVNKAQTSSMARFALIGALDAVKTIVQDLTIEHDGDFYDGS